MDYSGDVVGKGSVGQVRACALEKAYEWINRQDKDGTRERASSYNSGHNLVWSFGGSVAPVNTLVVFVKRFDVVEEAVR